MVDDKEHFSSRISSTLVQKIKEKAKREDTSITAIVEDAFKQYFKDELPGLCPSCHTQNDPDARYCSNCSEPLVEDAYILRTEINAIANPLDVSVTQVENQTQLILDEIENLNKRIESTEKNLQTIKFIKENKKLLETLAAWIKEEKNKKR